MTTQKRLFKTRSEVERFKQLPSLLLLEHKTGLTMNIVYKKFVFMSAVALFLLIGCGRNDRTSILADWAQTSSVDKPKEKLEIGKEIHSSKMLVGLSRAAIVAQLGKPEYESKENIQYSLGKSSGVMGPVFNWLLVQFDDKSNCTATMLTKD